MTDQYNRQKLFEELVSARQELMRSLAFLTEEEATAMAVHASWRVRDVISHIAARECTVLASVQHLVEDGVPRFLGPVDDREFNLRAISRRQDFSLEDVVDELDGIRGQLLKIARRLSNQNLYARFEVEATGGSQSLAESLHNLLDHDYLHAFAIWRWRAEMGVLHRDDFLGYLLDQRNELLGALGGLYEEDMVVVPVCGQWTTRDVLAHVLSWDEEALLTAQHWSEERPWQDGALYDDEWNEEEVAKRADLDAIALADGLATNHRKLVLLFQELDDQALIAEARAPWSERMTLLSFFYEMAAHDSVHVPDLLKAHEIYRDYE
jgi:hypothetical protein